jgi:hypothetical protein
LIAADLILIETDRGLMPLPFRRSRRQSAIAQDLDPAGGANLKTLKNLSRICIWEGDRLGTPSEIDGRWT